MKGSTELTSNDTKVFRKRNEKIYFSGNLVKRKVLRSNQNVHKKTLLKLLYVTHDVGH